jgi:peptide/nickel transport system permease protein
MVPLLNRSPTAPLSGTARRLFDGVLTAWAAVSLTFFALRLSAGDPVAGLLSHGLTTSEQAEQLRHRLGYDLPLLQQYVHYLGQLVRGDLGVSLYSGQPVTELIGSALPSTLGLAGSSLLIAIPLGAVLGGVAGWSSQPTLRRLAGTLASLATSLPVAATGVIGLLILGRLGGADSPAPQPGLWLPATVLGWAAAGPFARAVQAGLQSTRHSPFILAARARGLRQNGRLIWHAVRPTLPAIASLLAVEVAFLFAGTVVIETVFSRPGLGRILVRSILQGDFPIAQALVGLSALFYVAAQVVADSLARSADPRLRGRA